jgi:AcrR family transcriptional regulator
MTTKKPRILQRKMPIQARSQATVDVILKASTRVLERYSLAGFNTNRVAEVAGVSVGSIYQYFPSKDALVAALIDAQQQKLVAEAEALVAGLQGKRLEAKLQALCQLAIEQQYHRPKLSAALDHEEQRLPLTAQLQRTRSALSAALMRLLRPDLPELTEQEVADVFTIVQAIVEADANGRTAPPDLLVRLMRAVRGYLLDTAKRSG